jgi:hypothetical protein
MFLKRTIEDILEHSEADTEIIVVLDGAWADPAVEDHERVTLVYHPVSIGQRAACNEAARLARGEWVMKCDAHCSFAQGFDRILLEDIEPDVTMVPLMRNLHVFDWVCKNGHRRYQGPSGPCKECGEPTERDIVWRMKPSPNSTSYAFDPSPKFCYFGDFKKRPEGKGDITETMSLQGSCWMLSKDKYFELGVCDESWGSWGSQGIEVACKTWLSGGRVLCNKRTMYAHCFRTKTGTDWGFPYPLKKRQTDYAQQCAKEAFFDGKWAGAIRPLSWLIEKFWPVPHWTDEDLAALKPNEMPTKQECKSNGSPTKAIVYYTDNRLDDNIMSACQHQLVKSGLPIYSVSLQPLYFGHNITLPLERGPLTMFKQILAGLEACDADIVYLAEHDLLYHPSHFEFTPERTDLFYYNNNVWKVDAESGRALFHYSNHTSQLCAHRSLLLEHYRERVRRVEAEGFSRRIGFEPGTTKRKERIDDYWHETWMSPIPNIDIRHRHNLTQSRWRKDQFRNQRYTKGWTESDSVPGWGKTKGRFKEILIAVSNGHA